MKLVIPLDRITGAELPLVGGKCSALARMAGMGIGVPFAVSVTVMAYRQYMDETGLGDRITLELNRKSFADMRWEEIWDASLRIRNMFLGTPLPGGLHAALSKTLQETFGGHAVVVRSSAPEEDTQRASFAGLHESYVNISGVESVIDAIRLVWASLWSDAALLYRQELGLDVRKSAMAVIVQEIIRGERSGVAFGRNPNNASQAVIEAVYGLNQGLVDGTVEPDRWLLDRSTGRIISHMPVRRENAVMPLRKGVAVQPLSPGIKKEPPLHEKDIRRIYELLSMAEEVFRAPQDMEWTIRDDEVFVLQARPITGGGHEETGDKRHWYLSLRRSFENLRMLRKKIEQEIVPAMISAADGLSAADFKGFTKEELAAEVISRVHIYNHWVEVYWKDLIPFAHGIRLFGIAYNDAVRPSDPYEFIDLLASTEMEATERNRMLEEMAAAVRNDPLIAQNLRNRVYSGKFGSLLVQFTERFGDLFCGAGQCVSGPDAIADFILALSSAPAAGRRAQAKDLNVLTGAFLSRFPEAERPYARELLDLGRASYQMRDNDNIYLGKIRGQVMRAIEEYMRCHGNDGDSMNAEVRKAIESMRAPDTQPDAPAKKEMTMGGYSSRARQITGQPAGPGLGRGTARVVSGEPDLLNFRAGEILVCDAIDPSITFVVPLAAGIVERRGGMLIHGAIIAREYGLPCVTGVPDATVLIHTGDTVTVDGYLGIVTIG